MLVSRSELVSALAKVVPVATRKSSMPVLENIMLRATGGVLVVQATDLDVTITAECPCDAAGGDFAALMLGHKLFEIVRAMNGADVTLERSADNGRVAITSGRSKFDVASASPDEWPRTPEHAGRQVRVDGHALRELLDRTAYAQSDDETRYVLGGIYLEARDGVVIAASTDGHRLALSTRSVVNAEELFPAPTILPRRGVEMLRRLIDGSDEPVSVALDKSHATFSRDGHTLSMRLVEGRYPDYRQVIPEKADLAVQVPADELVGALRRVSLVAAHTSGAVLRLHRGTLALSLVNVDIGEAHEEIAVAYEGKPFRVGFNASYLVEAVKKLGADDVVLGFGDEFSPLTVKPATGTANDVAVVMPMRV